MSLKKVVVPAVLLCTLFATGCATDEPKGVLPVEITQEITSEEPAPPVPEPIPEEPAPVPEPEPIVEVAPPPPPSPAPPVATDPNMGTCKEAKAAGYGPYTSDQPEYHYYADRDGDGVVCE